MTDAPVDLQEQFIRFMAKKGLNTTSQRRAIAEIFFGLPGHHSLEEFYKEISLVDPGIGQTTVYRTLKLLCEAGLASEIQFNDNITRYEIANPKAHHDHLICVECGLIVEICDPNIERLQKEVARDNGFKLYGHSHNLYGLCPECQKRI